MSQCLLLDSPGGISIFGGLFLAGNRITHLHRHMPELGHRDLARMPCDSHHELNAPLKLISLP